MIETAQDQWNCVLAAENTQFALSGPYSPNASDY